MDVESVAGRITFVDAEWFQKWVDARSKVFSKKGFEGWIYIDSEWYCERVEVKLLASFESVAFILMQNVPISCKRRF